MSFKVFGLVFEYYPNGGGEMLLALKLAEHAQHDGTSIFPSVATMARHTRQSERTVQYQIKKMRAAGWLQLVKPARGGGRGGEPGRPTEYRINPEWIVKCYRAAASEGADVAPNSENGVQLSNEMGATAVAQMGATAVAQMGATAIAPEPSLTVIEPPHTAAPHRNQFTKRSPQAARVWVAPALNAIRTAGVTSVPAYSQQIEILLDKGVSVEQFAEAAAIAARNEKGVDYVIGVIKRKLKEVRKLRDMHTTGAVLAWDSSRSGIEAKAVSLGLGPWDEGTFNTGRGENFLQYTARVKRAEAEAGQR